jgi:putative ABC transport system permease protein
VENVATMEQVVRGAIAPWRFSAATIGLLGIVALGLTSLGIYAVMSQTVIERTREIGVRVAVGALPRQIATLLLRDSLQLATVGVGIGLALAIGGARALNGLLFGVQAADLATLAGAAAVFIATSGIAVLGPVSRASRVDPVHALRQQ